MSKKHPTAVDESCVRAAMNTALNLFDHEYSPLSAVLVVPIWQNEGEPGYQSCPAMMGEPEALPWLAKVLREVADSIDAGDYQTVQRGQPVGQA